MAEVQNIRVQSQGEDGSLVFRTNTGGYVMAVNPNAGTRALTVTTSMTLGASDSGLVVVTSTTPSPLILTIPQASTTIAGMYTIVNGAQSYGVGTVCLLFNTTNYFIGGGRAVSGLGQYLTLTTSTSWPGDFVEIAMGASTTWVIRGIAGTWVTS